MGFGLVPTPIAAAVVFPFEPDGGEAIQEKWRYPTNVIVAASDAEQRIALRARPILELSWTVAAFSADQAGLLDQLLYTTLNNRWYVPIWPSQRLATGVAGGVYTLDDMTGALFAVNEHALVWLSPLQCDLMLVTAVSGTGVTLAGATSWGHARGVVVVPIAIGALSLGQRTTDRINRATRSSVTFVCDRVNTPQPVPGAIPQYFEGAELLSLHPSASGQEASSWGQTGDLVGPETGMQLWRPLGATPVVGRARSWVLTTWAEIAAFRDFLFRQRGRKMAFWAPSYTDDFTLTAPVPAGQTFVTVVPMGMADQITMPSRARLVVLQPSGTVYAFRVLSVVASAGVERLNLNGAVPVALDVTTRICWLTYVRLGADDVTLNHMAPGCATVDQDLVELPREILP